MTVTAQQPSRSVEDTAHNSILMPFLARRERGFQVVHGVVRIRRRVQQGTRDE